jgi:hypothetical protein
MQEVGSCGKKETNIGTRVYPNENRARVDYIYI